MLPPSLTLSYDGGALPEEGFTLSYNDHNPIYIDIEAVNVEWNISVEDEGDSAGWLNAVKTDKGAVIQVLDGNENNSSEARRCTVRITADTEGIGPFEIPVTQEGKTRVRQHAGRGCRFRDADRRQLRHCIFDQETKNRLMRSGDLRFLE